MVLAGGVALNCVANGHLMREKVFDDIWIQPAAGDAGGALGAALLVAHGYFDVPREVDGTCDSQSGSYLGPAYSTDEIRAFLDRHDLPGDYEPDLEVRTSILAKALAEGKVLGHFAGRMEFGPRALGSRSIIADPRNVDTQSTVNLKIKYRESFRPFAPSVLEEDVGNYFEIDGISPYMLIFAPVNKDRRLEMKTLDDEDDLVEIVNQARSDLPAITHVDYSARIQTVDGVALPEFYALLEAFKAETGVGALVNTSFNVRGEPIVCSPKDAYACFMRTEMDVLVLGDYVLWKSAQPEYEDREDWRSIYGND